MHDLVHVLLLVAFLAAVAGSFLAIALPFVMETARKSLKAPIALGATAIAAFGADWLLHRV